MSEDDVVVVCGMCGVTFSSSLGFLDFWDKLGMRVCVRVKESFEWRKKKLRRGKVWLLKRKDVGV